MSELDALLTPTTRETAPALARNDEADPPAVLTRFVNWFGPCALSLPCGLSADGLPTDLQVPGRPHQEALVLEIGAAHEATRGPFGPPALGSSLAVPVRNGR